MNKPRIAIPMPHSFDPEYAARAMPQYERAVELCGGEPIRIALDQDSATIMKILASCDAVLLPGSKADVDPAHFRASRSSHTAAADPARDAVDDLLLRDADAHRKPVLGICYGLQSLNVHRGGSLVQHIPDFLPEETRTKVNHDAGKNVAIAHTVEIDPESQLARVICSDSRPRLSGRALLGSAVATEANTFLFPVNSSHHQSVDAVGKGLRIVAHCTADGIVEAVEGTSQDHFVLAVQWHPERSVDDDETSRAIFRALVEAAQPRS